MTQIASQCMFCEHFDLDTIETNRCTAYPRGIPSGILLNLVDHRQPQEGDHGIQFLAIADHEHPMEGLTTPIDNSDPMFDEEPT